MAENFALFSGTANPVLAEAVARELGSELGACKVERFPDGEVHVEVQETVRRRHVFLLQPTSPPVNEHLVELLAFIDACRRSAAERVTAIVPYLGYSRSDRRHGRREPISARMVADCLQAVGLDHLITLDLHTPQIEGFFRIPVESLTAVPPLCERLREHLPDGTVVVAPDAGRVPMATDYARRLFCRIAVLHKKRESSTETVVTDLVGDVTGQHCLLIDDMVSTGGTLGKSIEALLKAGARPGITVAVTHGLFLKGAWERIQQAGVGSVYVTDSVPAPPALAAKLQVVSVAPLIAASIARFLSNGSLTGSF